jgi:imidazolonepropionase-like amidohydrolase
MPALLPLLAAPLFLFQAPQPQRPDTARTLAIVGASVLPMDGVTEVLHDATVLVRGSHIAAVGPSSRVTVPAGAQRIDGRGKWVMPGLVDAHTHFMWPTRAPERDLPLYLASGVTTVRNMRGVPEHLALRDRVARGDLVGPTIYTGGPYLERTPAGADAKQAVIDVLAAGYDFVKIHDHDVGVERYTAFARAAREVGIPLMGHVPREVDLAIAVREGQRTIEHVENLMQGFFAMKLDTTRFPALVATLKAGSGPTRPPPCVVPTLVVFDYVVKNAEDAPTLATLQARPELRYIREALLEGWAPERNTYVAMMARNASARDDLLRRLRDQRAFLLAMTRALSDGGIPLAAGSDAGVAFTLPGWSLTEELVLLRRAGLTPLQVLRAATSGAAACMGMESEFGRVTPGLRADLLLLDRDPRAALEATGAPEGVVLRGRWIAKGELRRMLEGVARR